MTVTVGNCSLKRLTLLRHVGANWTCNSCVWNSGSHGIARSMKTNSSNISRRSRSSFWRVQNSRDKYTLRKMYPVVSRIENLINDLIGAIAQYPGGRRGVGGVKGSRGLHVLELLVVRTVFSLFYFLNGYPIFNSFFSRFRVGYLTRKIVHVYMYMR